MSQSQAESPPPPIAVARPAVLSWHDWVAIGLLWLVALGMNMARPITVDDPCFLASAKQLATNPTDPYGYTFAVLEWPETGMFVPCPPVVPVVNAACITLFGVHEQALKAWMTPFAFLLIWSMVRLAKPWAGRWLYAGVFVALAGPIVLPSLRLMIDIPAAAMVMAALVFFRDYLEGINGRWTLGAAIVCCALAPLTKYTGFTAFGAIMLMAWLYGRPILGIAAAAIAALPFIGWELWAYLTFGVTHLAYQAEGHLIEKDIPWLLQGLITLTANGMPVMLGAAAYALGLRPVVWVGLTLAGLTSVGLLLVMEVPDWVFQIQSVLLWLAIGWMAWSLLGLTRKVQAAEAHDGNEKQDAAQTASQVNIDRFVVGLLAIELIVMFAVSPFPAYRRIIGVMLAAGLLISRYAARHRAHQADKNQPTTTLPAMPTWPALGLLVLGSLATSLLCYYGERAYAQGIVRAMEQAKAYVMAQPEPTTLYVAGRWSVPFYAEQMDIPEIVLDQTALKPGDMALIASGGMYMPIVSIEPGSMEEVKRYHPTDNEPLNPIGVYGGTSGLRHNQGVGIEFSLWKVLKPTIIRVQPTPEQMALGVLPRKWPPSPLASWSLIEFAMREPDVFNNPYARKFLEWKDPFILRGLEHPSATARLWMLTFISQNPSTLTAPVRQAVDKLKADKNTRVNQAAKSLVP